MKKILLLSICILLLPIMLISCRSSFSGNPIATITMNDGGIIEIELYYDIAPITVRNFVDLAEDGFYDGLIFHRVSPTFMIQGGCPDGTGMGYPGHRIPCELDNNPSHRRGILSMANTGDPNTGGSQFFILTRDSQGLDGRHTAFGRVLSGMDVVDRIANQEGTAIGDGTVRPSNPMYIVSIEITLYDDIVYTATGSDENGTPTDTNNGNNQQNNAPPATETPPATEGVQNPIARILMSDGNAIEVILYYDIAPNTVRNFIYLAKGGFYDGVIFHRVSPTFMIQGGCPNGVGNGGPGYTIRCETANNPTHVPGVLSMAHAGPNTGGSQFFIMTGYAPWLDGGHTAFGRVASEMCLDTIDIIASQTGQRNEDRTIRPSNPLYIDRIEIETHGHTFAPPVTSPRR